MMKKKIMIFLLLVVLLPFPVNATPTIKKTRLIIPDSVAKGTSFSFTFSIDFLGIEKDKKDGQGIAGVEFEIDYDDDLLVLTDIQSQQNTWKSQKEEEDGIKYISSTITESNQAGNKCTDGILNCTNYMVTVSFYLKNTETETTTISIGRTNVILLDKFDFNREYTEEEIIKNAQLVSINANETKVITITQSDTPVSEQIPEPFISSDDKNLQLDFSQMVAQQIEKVQKLESNNNYIKSLQIENYEINFRKTKKEYDLKIDQGINELQIKVELDDERETYKIIGADNLKENDNQVTIEVTAENGEKNIYTIHIKEKIEDVDSEKIITNTKTDNGPKIKINKIYLIVGGIGFVVFMTLIFIIKKIIDRKLDKALDEML